MISRRRVIQSAIVASIFIVVMSILAGSSVQRVRAAPTVAAACTCNPAGLNGHPYTMMSYCTCGSLQCAVVTTGVGQTFSSQLSCSEK